LLGATAEGSKIWDPETSNSDTHVHDYERKEVTR